MDIWYRTIVPQSGELLFRLDNNDGLGVQILTGGCANFNSVFCNKKVAYSGTTFPIKGLTPNDTVTIRLFQNINTAGIKYSSTFKMTAYTPIKNDNCVNAIKLDVADTYIPAEYSNEGALPSDSTLIPNPICSKSRPINDVWFKLVIPALGKIKIKLEKGETSDYSSSTIGNPSYAIYRGGYKSLIPYYCYAPQTGINNIPPVFSDSTLSPGDTIYCRIWGSWSYSVGDGGRFKIGAWSTNDEPQFASELTVNETLKKQAIDLSVLTASLGIPAPSCSGPINNDAWYKITIPEDSTVTINVTKDIATNGDSATLAVYSGTQSSLIFETCNDGKTSRDKLPYIRLEHKKPGDVYYLRLWSNGKKSLSFNIGAFRKYCSDKMPEPTDKIKNTPIICQLDGFCGTTRGNPYYTVDTTEGALYGGYLDRYQPKNAYFHLDGINGPQAGYLFNSNTSLENTSWISFIANAQKIDFQATVANCDNLYQGGASPGGIQIAFLQGDTINGFYELKTGNNWQSGIIQNDSTVTFNLTNLIIGKRYYALIDGIAGDVCDYQIKAKYSLNPINAGRDTTVCSGAVFTRTLADSVGLTYRWYSDPAKTNLLSTSNTATLTSPVKKGIYNIYIDAFGPTMCSNAIATDTFRINVVNCNSDTTVVDTTGMNFAKVIGLPITDTCLFDYSKPIDSLDISGYTFKGDSTILHWKFYQNYKLYTLDIPVPSSSLTNGNMLFYCTLRCTKLRGILTKTFGASVNYTITGIAIYEKEQIKLFPNPTNDVLNISLPEESKNVYTIELYSLDSKLLQTKQTNKNSTTLDVQSLNQGIYILKVFTVKNIYIARFVKQ